MQFRFQCIKQWVNQFSNTQRSVTAVGNDVFWWSSVSNKLPPILILYLHKPTVPSEVKCCLSLIAAACVYLFECVECVGGRKIRTEYFWNWKRLHLLNRRNGGFQKLFILTVWRKMFKLTAVIAIEKYNVDILMQKDQVPAPYIDMSCVGRWSVQFVVYCVMSS